MMGRYKEFMVKPELSEESHFVQHVSEESWLAVEGRVASSLQGIVPYPRHSIFVGKTFHRDGGHLPDHLDVGIQLMKSGGSMPSRMGRHLA